MVHGAKLSERDLAILLESIRKHQDELKEWVKVGLPYGRGAQPVRSRLALEQEQLRFELRARREIAQRKRKASCFKLERMMAAREMDNEELPLELSVSFSRHFVHYLNQGLKQEGARELAAAAVLKRIRQIQATYLTAA